MQPAHPAPPLRIGVSIDVAPAWAELAGALARRGVEVTALGALPAPAGTRPALPPGRRRLVTILSALGGAATLHGALPAAEARAAAAQAAAKGWIQALLVGLVSGARPLGSVGAAARLVGAAGAALLLLPALWLAVVAERLLLGLCAPLLLAPARLLRGLARGSLERAARDAGCDVWLAPHPAPPLDLPGPLVLSIGPGVKDERAARRLVAAAARVHVQQALAASGGAGSLLALNGALATFPLPGEPPRAATATLPEQLGLVEPYVVVLAGDRRLPAHDVLAAALAAPDQPRLVFVGSAFSPVWADLVHRPDRAHLWLGVLPRPLLASVAARARLVVLPALDEVTMRDELLALVSAGAAFACPDVPGARVLLGDERLGPGSTWPPDEPAALARLVARLEPPLARAELAPADLLLTLLRSACGRG